MNQDILLSRIRALSAPLAPIPTDIERRVTRLPGIRCVVFDVYGTLLVSGSGDVGTAATSTRDDALTEALTAVGLSSLCDAASVGAEWLKNEILADHERRQVQGVEQPEVEIRHIWQTVCSRLAEKAGERVVLDSAQVELLAVEYECRVNPVWPMPGARETLEQITAAGMSLGIVSNAQFYTPLTFRALLGDGPEGLGFPAHRCVWSYELGAAKPSPEMFGRLCKGLTRDRFLPEECLYVGNDMLNDVYAASRAGLQTALFAGDRRSLQLREDDARCAITPDVVITELKDLREVLT